MRYRFQPASPQNRDKDKLRIQRNQNNRLLFTIKVLPSSYRLPPEEALLYAK